MYNDGWGCGYSKRGSMWRRIYSWLYSGDDGDIDMEEVRYLYRHVELYKRRKFWIQECSLGYGENPSGFGSIDDEIR